MPTLTLPSRWAKRGQNCDVTIAFLGVPNKGDKNRSGYFTSVFSGAGKRAEVLRNACILGGPQLQGQNQKWLPYPFPPGGPKEGGIATYPLHTRGSPSRGTKSEVATLTLPSRGPKGGLNCYATLAFTGVPTEGDKI